MALNSQGKNDINTYVTLEEKAIIGTPKRVPKPLTPEQQELVDRMRSAPRVPHGQTQWTPPTSQSESTHDDETPMNDDNDLSPEQERQIEEQVDDAMERADIMIATHQQMEALLGEAVFASYVIDYFIDTAGGTLIPIVAGTLMPVVGGTLVSVVGDGVSSLCGLYIIQKARQAGVPNDQIKKMFINLAKDFLIGAIPFVGDFFDFLYRANHKNVEIFKEFVEMEKKKTRKPAPTTPSQRRR